MTNQPSESNTPKDKKVILYVDYENIHISLVKHVKKMIDLEKFNVFRETVENDTGGQVISAKAFSIWKDLRPQQESLDANGITTVNIISNGSNATDIGIVVDCLDMVFQDLQKDHPEITTVALFTGDGGYAPLVNSLIDRYDKEVYVYSVAESANTRAFQRIKDKHQFIGDKFPDALRDLQSIDTAILDLILILNSGLKERPYITRGSFLNYVIHKHGYTHLTMDSCGALLDEAIKYNLIKSELKTRPGKDKPTRCLTVNNEHPEVQALLQQPTKPNPGI